MCNLLITTTSRDIAKEIEALSMPGSVRAKQVGRRMQLHEEVTVVLEFIVEISKEVDIALLVAWLLQKASDYRSHKTEIEHRPVVDNRTEITTIINNHIHVSQNGAEDDKQQDIDP